MGAGPDKVFKTTRFVCLLPLQRSPRLVRLAADDISGSPRGLAGQLFGGGPVLCPEFGIVVSCISGSCNSGIVQTHERGINSPKLLLPKAPGEVDPTAHCHA